MTRFLFFIDSLSAWVGKAFAWCILVLTFAFTYEVFVRYVLTAPTDWAFDISYTMYGALFMMGGAYTLSQGGHVRGDVLYRLWPPRVQAAIEFVLFFLFFFPGVLALIYAGIPFAADAWRLMEVSSASPADIPVYPLKTLIPAAASILLLQGIAEVIRCVLCIKHGQWPQRLRDVEDIEDKIIAELAEREHALEKELHLENGDEGGAK
jgi:TRAP-type mannitol/chloroaromatic compound transport system permease small subunit